MGKSIILNNDELIAGVTLKDDRYFESNNMALHQCVNENHIIKNRKKLARFLHVSLDHFVCANQTHSDQFYKVTKKDIGRGAIQTTTAIPYVDALYTNEKNVVLTCFTADCVPLIFYDERKGIIGVIHSGWKGTVQEITKRLFKHLIKVEHCQPEHIHVYLGPSISQEKFEVDEDVYFLFEKLGYASSLIYYNNLTDKYHIDNQKVVKRQCEMVGIPRSQIKLTNMCTYISEKGFSHRQDKHTGRHLSFVMKKG